MYSPVYFSLPQETAEPIRLSPAETWPLRPQSEWPGIRPLRLWELILADIAEAEFVEAAVSQLMQSIHHVVMTTLKSSINPGSLQYLQFERSFQVIPTPPVGERHETVEPGGAPTGTVFKAHRRCAPEEIVGTQTPAN